MQAVSARANRHVCALSGLAFCSLLCVPSCRYVGVCANESPNILEHDPGRQAQGPGVLPGAVRLGRGFFFFFVQHGALTLRCCRQRMRLMTDLEQFRPGGTTFWVLGVSADVCALQGMACPGTSVGPCSRILTQLPACSP